MEKSRQALEELSGAALEGHEIPSAVGVDTATRCDVGLVRARQAKPLADSETDVKVKLPRLNCSTLKLA